MERRLRALVRKAAPAPPLAAASDDLIRTLCSRVTTKREYEDVFEDAGTAEAFALRLALPEAQAQLLMAMQAVKEIFVPNVWLDRVLTVIFVVECLLVLGDMASKRLLFAFCAILFLADCVVSRVKFLASSWGRRLSKWLWTRGFVDSDPLAGRIQMKKWQEQSWQLFVHTSFTAAALSIFAREPWYDHPDTCWIPHPYEQVKDYPMDLRVFYLCALAVWMYTCFVHR